MSSRHPGTARIALLASLGLVLAGCDAGQALDNATRYAARVSCSCVYVSGRDLAACIDDLPDAAQWLDIEDDRAARAVHARALWIRGSAFYTEGHGCRLGD